MINNEHRHIDPATDYMRLLRDSPSVPTVTVATTKLNTLIKPNLRGCVAENAEVVIGHSKLFVGNTQLVQQKEEVLR